MTYVTAPVVGRLYYDNGMKHALIILGLAGVFLANSATASNLASDNASASAYNNGWPATNGGSGFGPWQFALTNPGSLNVNGHFIGDATLNGNGLDDGVGGGVAGDGDINSTLGPVPDVSGLVTNVTAPRAWGLYANNGQSIAAVRPFTGGPLTTGQTVRVDFDNGYIGAGFSDGIGVQNTAGQTLWEWYFPGGGTNYINHDAAGNITTTIPYGDEGIHVDFTSTGPSSYQVVVTRRDGVTQTITGQLIAATDQGVAQFRCWNYSAGVNNPYNMMINNLQIVPASFSMPHVTLSVFPKNFQVYPRDRQTNRATVPIAGTVDDAGYDQITLRVYRGTSLFTNLTQSLAYSDGQAPFSFATSITAELTNYNFYISVVKTGQETQVAAGVNVAAGDLLLVNGQSNAEAEQRYDSSDFNQHPFLRSFGTRSTTPSVVTADPSWHEAEGDAFEGPGAVGQWALHMGRLLVDTYQVPIVIINGARGGEVISYFQRNDSIPGDMNTNYGRLLWRVSQAGMLGAVRAILWYQGEQDNNDGVTHEAGFIHLYQAWLQDYPSVERVYVHQVRAGCGVDQFNVDLRNRQRLLADTFPGIEVISTTGIDAHDTCHFYYANGYELIANHNFALVARDLYGAAPANNVDAPNIAYAYFSKPTHDEITLIMRNKSDSLTWESGVNSNFIIQGSAVQVTGGSVASNTLILTLSGDASGASAVAYTGHPGPGPWVLNGTGVGLLSFYNEPIHTNLAPPDVPAGLTATPVSTNLITLAWADSSAATGYIVKRDGAPIGTTSTAGYDDFGLTAGAQCCYTVIATGYVGSSAESLPACAMTLSPVPPGSAPPFYLDETANNYPGYLLNSPGMTLYAAIRGTTLYVATWSPGVYPGDITRNDHFIMVTDELSPMQPAFPTWFKLGQNAVDPGKPFLAGESDNHYVGWQNTTAACSAVKAATNAGQMQGTIDLVQAFGHMPTTIYLCAAAYITTNGGALAAQAPAAVEDPADGNIESNEFLAVPVGSISDSLGNGVFDALDPARRFAVQTVQPAAGGLTVTWVAVPGKTYQVLSGDSLGGDWSVLGLPITAGSGQGTLSYTDASATNSPQRFYRVKLLN